MPVTKYNMNYAVVVLGAIAAFALGWFAVDARKWFKRPKMTVEDNVVATDHTIVPETHSEDEKIPPA